ncbi:MAG: fumarylacetoacetate hydrolase family protein [Myxococcales bacterium]|nr:fumarylacetoacetate hydrolase family protein [Myxococcales bacterium]
MKLASFDDGSRDGALRVVNRDGSRAADASDIAPSLQAALDDWDALEPVLQARARELDSGSIAGEALQVSSLCAPLPRAYEWVDGSAFLSHILLVRKARGAEPPPTLYTEPLVYQGGSSVLLSPQAPLHLGDSEQGLDLEGEIAVILGDTPRGTDAREARSCVKLFMLVNDVTYRSLVPAELEKGFGFFCSKPASAFSPFAITPDELGDAYREGRVHLPLHCYRNDELIGQPNAEAMHFSFFDLIAHICQTRAFAAGTIVGSGTVSNDDPARGVACLAELRMRELLEYGAPRTPFLRAGDRVRIEMLHPDGSSLFGAIEQEVVA